MTEEKRPTVLDTGTNSPAKDTRTVPDRSRLTIEELSMTTQSAPHPVTLPTNTEPTIAAAAARQYVRQLRDYGVTFRAMAEAAGIGIMTIHDLAAGQRQSSRETAAAVLRLRQADLPVARVDAGGTRLRLRALHVMGHGSGRLARAAGVSDGTIRAIVTGEARTVSALLRVRVTVVYDRWWDKRAPERTPAERAAATVARRCAIHGNWCAAAALDDDELDRPGYKPKYGWRPAAGTGVADDPDWPWQPPCSARR